MSNSYSQGLVFGFIFAFLAVAILSVLVSRKANTDKKLKTKYDERQQMVRGRAYKYSFWILVFLICLYSLIDSSDIELPCTNTVLIFGILLLTVLFHAVYCILNDGYFGINNKPRTYYAMFVIIGLFNIMIGVMNTIHGSIWVNGKLDVPVVNYFAGFMFIVVGIAIAIRSIMNKASDDDEEDEDYDIEDDEPQDDVKKNS